MLEAALHAHLFRLLAWAVFSLAAGVLIRRSFGLMNAAWGAVDLIIALASLRGRPPGNEFRPFLAFNLGLDLGYIGVGVAMAILGKEGARVRGFGWAVAVQGAALFALDGVLWHDLSGLPR